MRLAYLGEIMQDSYVTWCLKKSGKFDRIDHLTKPTLDFVHVGMNPLPDGIVVKCDWEDNELTWVKRYSIDIPKIFVVCDHCLRKTKEYNNLGFMFNLMQALKSEDLFLDSLVNFIIGNINYGQTKG